jgi:hypothetical protein
MKPEDSLPHLQVPATCPYPEPDQFIYKCPPPVPILSRINLFTSARHLSLYWAESIYSAPPSSDFFKIQLNIFIPSTPGS